MEEAVNLLSNEKYGIHYIIIYHDLATLRQFYSMHIKKQLEEKDEMVVFAPSYETTYAVRQNLYSGHTAIDVARFERENVLLIIDALKLYYYDEITSSFVDKILNHAARLEKKGVSLLGDVGPFHYKHEIEKLVNYELSLPLRFSSNRKDLCLHNRKDFDQFSDEQKNNLVKNHGMVIELFELNGMQERE